MVASKLLSLAVLLLISTTATTASKFEHFKQYLHNSVSARQWEGTQEPVIGIVTQTLEKEMLADPRFKDYKYYIMQSYVDWLQAAGARVVPLI
jgi:hypothetical protein